MRLSSARRTVMAMTGTLPAPGAGGHGGRTTVAGVPAPRRARMMTPSQQVARRVHSRDMINQATVTSLSWIASESVSGAMKLGFSSGVSHYDAPPPDHLD